MSESNVLKQSTFPLNDNLEAIEADANGKYPFVFLMDEATSKSLIKLSDNLKALGKDPIDTNQLINEALASRLSSLLSANVHPHETTEYLNSDHFKYPRIGDTWSERPGTHYLRVVSILGDDDFIIHTYTSAGTGLMPGRYRVNHDWLGKFICYTWPTTNVDKYGVYAHWFCADVTPMKDGDERLAELHSPETLANELKYCTDVRDKPVPVK